jgi:Transposase DDE domain
MSSTRQLLINHNLEDLFVTVYTVTDDYINQSIRAGRFTLPEMKNQKASYAELMTIALVGEILHQAHAGTWFLLVRDLFKHLFRTLPDITRYYRIMRNLERIWADLALCLANTVDDDTTYSIDSKPIPICDLKRSSFPRAMTEAIYGYSSMGGVWGFKLHAVVNNVQMMCRFAIVPANEADVTVARCLVNANEDELDRMLGDKRPKPVRCCCGVKKAYLGMGIFTPSRENAKKPLPWTRLMGAARKLIETVFSSLTRGQHLVLGQLNSFWSVRASTCRKVAAHNLGIWLGL